MHADEALGVEIDEFLAGDGPWHEEAEAFVRSPSDSPFGRQIGSGDVYIDGQRIGHAEIIYVCFHADVSGFAEAVGRITLPESGFSNVSVDPAGEVAIRRLPGS